MMQITDRALIRAILAYNDHRGAPTWAIKNTTGTSCQLLEVEPGMMNEPNATVKIANGDIESLPLRDLHLRGKG
jgi:hypothetical protein